MDIRGVNFEDVENYYRRLVIEYISASLSDSPLAAVPGALEDVACLALNQLPPRYVRYSVDATFYASEPELEEMSRAVADAVGRAVEYVLHHPRGKDGAPAKDNEPPF